MVRRQREMGGRQAEGDGRETGRGRWEGDRQREMGGRQAALSNSAVVVVVNVVGVDKLLWLLCVARVAEC
jgi:hypothetical protein